MPFFSTMAGTRSPGSSKVSIIKNPTGLLYVTKYTNDGSLIWAASITGTTITTASPSFTVKTDSSGNIFVAGPWTTSVTLYSGTGGTSITLSAVPRSNVFIAKYNADGIIQWATYAIGSTSSITYCYGLTINPSGDVLMSGRYAASTIVTFSSVSPSSVTVSLPSVSTISAFIVKYNTNGIVQWATNVVPSVSAAETRALVTDSAGNIFTAGGFVGTVTFNSKSPDTTTKTLTAVGGQDAYVAKYNPDGIIQWVAKIGSSGVDYAFGIDIDSSANVYIAGYCNVPCTLFSASGGTPVSISNTQNNNYLAKYDTNGNVIWVAGNNGTQSVPFGVAVNSNQDIFMCNYALTTFTARSATGGTTKTFTVVGSIDVAISKYNSSGIIQWVAQIGSTGIDQPRQIATDSNGNVFVTGYYTGNVTFFSVSPSTKKKTLRSSGVEDAFVAKYDTNGVIQWAAQLSSTGIDTGYGLHVDPSGNVITTGTTVPPVTFVDAV
jgi:hypothetical protein